MNESTIYSRVVALTGIIGSGKSTIAKMFAALGADVISADTITHEILSSNANVQTKLRAIFGEKIFDDSGSINKKVLANVVFSEPKKLKELENILHPLIKEESKKQFGHSSAKVIIYECPLFFKTKLNLLPFRAVVVVKADKDTCIERVCQRDSCQKSDVINRLSSQIPSDQKVAKADYVIDNSKDKSYLKEQVEALYDKLLVG